MSQVVEFEEHAILDTFSSLWQELGKFLLNILNT